MWWWILVRSTMKKTLLISIIFVLCVLTDIQINDIIVQNIDLGENMVEIVDIFFDFLIISVLVYEWIKILRHEEKKRKSV